MTQTHTSYEFSKRLKEFLGESAPEPMEDCPKAYYGEDPLCYAHDEKDTAAHKYTFDGFAYQLHDLLSKPFCEAFVNACKAKHEIDEALACATRVDWGEVIGNIYYMGGLPAVEKALTEMMEGR